jgi:hypothetical protein
MTSDIAGHSDLKALERFEQSIVDSTAIDT